MKKLLTILAFCLAALSCSPMRNGSQPLASEEDILWKIMKNYPEESLPASLYSEGLYNGLINGNPEFSKYIFHEVLKRDSTHSASYYELAQLYRSQPDSALYFVEKAFELEPSNVWYHTLLGELYIGAGRYDSALAVYNTLLKTDPRNANNYRLLAALYEIREQPLSAISILDSAENVLGKNPEITAFKRQLYMNMSLFAQAIKEAEELLEIYPLDVTNYVALAELYSLSGKDSIAISYYDEAMEISPDNLPTLISMNTYYRNRNNIPGLFYTARKLFLSNDIDVDNKVGFFKELTRSRTFYQNNFMQLNDLAMILAAKHPENFDVVDLYAGHLIASGKLEDAQNIYKTYLKGSEPNLKIYNNIMDFEAYMGRTDSLNKYAGMALRDFPGNADIYIRKASGMSYLMKDYKSAEKELLKALKYAGSDSLKSVIYSSLGDNRYSMNDYKKCYNYYDLALKYDSLNIMLLNNYSYYLSERDMRLDDAQRMAIKVEELSGGSNPTYIDTYAWILYKQGRYKEALAKIKRAVSLDPTNSPELYFHYAEILYVNDESFLAKTYWQRALEYGYDPDIINERIKRLDE